MMIVVVINYCWRLFSCLNWYVLIVNIKLLLLAHFISILTYLIRVLMPIFFNLSSPPLPTNPRHLLIHNHIMLRLAHRQHQLWNLHIPLRSSLRLCIIIPTTIPTTTNKALSLSIRLALLNSAVVVTITLDEKVLLSLHRLNIIVVVIIKTITTIVDSIHLALFGYVAIVDTKLEKWCITWVVIGAILFAFLLLYILFVSIIVNIVIIVNSQLLLLLHLHVVFIFISRPHSITINLSTL